MRGRAAVVALALVCAPLAATVPPAAAADPGGQPVPGVLDILPPGSNGNVDATDALTVGPSRTATPDKPPHFADQLEMYDALNKTSPGQLGASDLTKYYKTATLGIADADVVSVERPRPGLTIKRDRFGVPHIQGATFEDVEYGAGYANIEDRMFLTDVLRHTGAARLSEFIGATPGNIAMDREQLRIAAYTRPQAAAQVDAAARRYGAEGDRLVRGLDAMIAGMNAAQKTLCPVSAAAPVPGQPGAAIGPKCPAEYAALQKPAVDYDRADIIYIASLVGGIFGKGGGAEAANARWLQQLQGKYGVTEGRKVYDDLREKNDPEAPTTSTTPQGYLGGGIKETRPGTALPDLHPSGTAPGTGADDNSTGVTVPPLGPLAAPAQASPSFGVVDGPFGRIDLGLRPHGMSNALLVDGAHSADGHPTVVFGPQTGYFTPQLLVEQDLQGPGVRARGVSFAGTNLVVELGHGVDYAWSATSASNDIVDTVAERLCNADGSTATVTSTGYLVGGQCTPIEAYTHTETVLPSAASPTPALLRFQVQKTRHGVVQERTTVGGKPVALVLQRSTFNHEVDSAVGFARFQDPGFVHDAASFQRAASAIDYTFNWFYSDDRDISYFSSGLLPKRASGPEPDLPRYGDEAYDWQGTLPFSAHPRSTDPARGYLVSWNNKTAPGFSAADGSWSYGPVYRSLALEDRVKARITGGRKVTVPSLVDAMMDGGTVDVRAAYLLPEVLAVLGTPADPQDAAAVRLLREWLGDGAHRVDRDRTGGYDHQAAVDLLDVWWEPKAAGIGGDPTFALPRDVLRGTLGSLTDELPQSLDDHPRQGIGSSFNGIAWYGYVSKDLRQVLKQPVSGAYSRTYCGGGVLATCQEQLRASLHEAVQAALGAQGKTEPSQLTYDKHRDDIRSVTAGLVGVRPIDWQNRPTFQQVVHYTTRRSASRVAVAGGGGTADRPVGPGPTRTAQGRPLPATGASAALPAAGLLAFGLAGLLVRRRRAAR